MITACSFLPAATHIIYDLDLPHHLTRVTFKRPAQLQVDKPTVVLCILEGGNYNSSEIDRTFSASKAEQKSLCYVDCTILQQLAPDFDFVPQRSASVLVDGIKLLALLFHSSVFTLPPRLSSKVKSVHQKSLLVL